MSRVTAAPDPSEISNEQLKARIRDFVAQEAQLSATRAELHEEIDVLRGELVKRLRRDGATVVRGEDPDGDDTGLSGVREPRSPAPEEGSDGVLLELDEDADC
jgi:hypothetical protein